MRTEDEGVNFGRWLPDVVESLLSSEHAVPLYEVVHDHDAADFLSTTDLWRLFSVLRAQGYLQRAAVVANAHDSRDVEGQHKRRIGDLLQADLAVLTGAFDVSSSVLPVPYTAQRGRVLNVVGESLPDVDSSYSRRTHALAKQGRRLGLEISIATQMGQGEHSAYDVDDIDGIVYHRIPGSLLGSVSFDEWIKYFVKRLSAVVRKLRPSVIVASSDFVNGVAARAVCRAYGISFVYDVRGWREDSWLAEQRERYSWTRAQVPERWGLPDVCTLRREREAELIRSADAVVTMATDIGREIMAMGVECDRVKVLADVDSDITALVDIFEFTGVLDAEGTALARIDYSGADLARLVTEGERQHLGNIETFAGRGSVGTIRDRGWQHGSLEPVKITVPFHWIEACSDHRSQAYSLHAWDFMVPFLEAWSTDRDPDVLMWCLERAADWAETFNDGASHGSMAWYDMAIGRRAPRLAYLVQEAVHEGVGTGIIEALTRSVICHQRAVFAPQAFNANTNHGFYTAVGQLSFAQRLRGLPGMEIIENQGAERLRRVVATQFASDGGHLEHSPDYHRMLVSSFLGAMDDGLLTDPEVATRIKRAEEVTGWFLRPDRTVVQIGDSPSRLPAPSDRAMAAPHTAFLVTGGRAGKPNPQELLVLKEAGYAVVRSPQPTGREDHVSAGYLTFMAGFHSRAHKHCDDLSLTWFDGSHELLIDAGRFGYLDQLPPDSPQREEGFYYGRPERQYVERTRAHNTVQADGREHERRHRRPYGSALVSAEERDGTFHLVGEVDHGAWTHRRTVTYKPGTWLLVKDEMTGQDDQPHDFIVWWNFPEELTDPFVVDERVTFTLPGGRSLHVTSLGESKLLTPVKGEEGPLRGWRSIVDYEFTPAWSLAHKIARRPAHTFVTLLSLDDVPTTSEMY